MSLEQHPSSFFQVVVCRACQGATPDDVAALGRRLQVWVRKQPGFVSRRLLRDGATYVDLIEWDDRASADRASAATDHPSPSEMGQLLELEHATFLNASEVSLEP